MVLGVVTGCVWATKKAPGLGGLALLLVAREDGGPPFAAADTLGAGPGDRVLAAFGGAARQAAGRDCPVDAAIVGIVDRDGE